MKARETTQAFFTVAAALRLAADSADRESAREWRDMAEKIEAMAEALLKMAFGQ